jgi:hypothetical protein
LSKEGFTEEHFLNRLSVYRGRILVELRVFGETGYPANLFTAVYFYAVYRDLGLSFMIPFDDWSKLVEEAEKK